MRATWILFVVLLSGCVLAAEPEIKTVEAAVSQQRLMLQGKDGLRICVPMIGVTVGDKTYHVRNAEMSNTLDYSKKCQVQLKMNSETDVEIQRIEQDGKVLYEKKAEKPEKVEAPAKPDASKP